VEVDNHGGGRKKKYVTKMGEGGKKVGLSADRDSVINELERGKDLLVTREESRRAPQWKKWIPRLWGGGTRGC